METLEEVTAWVAANGMEALIAGQMPGGAFAGKTKYVVAAWLQIDAEQKAVAKAAVDDARAERMTKAAEVAALQAKRSADFARLSIPISLAALFVAAWPAFQLMKHLFH